VVRRNNSCQSRLNDILGRSRNHVKLEAIRIKTLFEEIPQKIDVIFQADALPSLDKMLSADAPEFRVVPQQVRQTVDHDRAARVPVARMRAARQAIDRAGGDTLLVGRSEGFVAGAPDLDETIRRLKAYAAAGADCLYAPGIKTREEIAAIVQAVAPKPVNVLISGFNHQLSFSQVADLGVRRISVGSGLALAAWGAFSRAARSIQEDGSFELLSEGAKSADLNNLFSASNLIKTKRLQQ